MLIEYNFIQIPISELHGSSVTDSTSNLSDISTNTAIANSGGNRQKMDIACVINLTEPESVTHRKGALEELKHACALVCANLHLLQVSNH